MNETRVRQFSFAAFEDGIDGWIVVTVSSRPQEYERMAQTSVALSEAG